MGGVRNGKSADTPEPAASRHEALRTGVPDLKPEEAARDAVDRQLRSAVGLLREGSAARAFGQLARASRTQAMTPRLAAALVRFALLAGTEAAAITLLDATPGSSPAVRLAVRRQLARVLRRVGQLPRAIAALEAVLVELPEDRRALRGLQVLRKREAQAATEASAARPAEPVAPASSVLAKLPTRKAGVQAAAVWAEDRSKTETELPALGTVQALSVPWADPPEERAAPPPAARDTRPQPPPVANAWADDEATGEVTSEALPLPPDDEPRGASPGAKPPGTEAPCADLPSSASGERTQAPAAAAATTAAGRDLPASPTLSPVATQEVSMADLEAALSGAPAPKPGEAEELARSRKLEAQLIARQAWRELAQLYLKRGDRAKDPAVRAEALTRLAEVMENELQDPAGAARMYREIVDLTGDRAALREQVRLLSTRGDASLVRRALDEAIKRARSARARAGALLTRGERWLHMGEPGKARTDFDAAEALVPGLLPVLAGLLRCVSEAERPATAERLRLALVAAPRRTPDRLEGLRMLAQAAEESLGDLRLAQWAWTEVLAENPESEQARGQLLALARKLGDPKTVGQLLRAQLARESRGSSARQARLELVSTLDALGDDESALNELRQAVRYEPGHKEAWLLLVDRLTARGSMGEAAWALEHAATTTEDAQERERVWERLAGLWRDVLHNPERSQVFARRAESLRQAREEREVAPPEPPRGARPRREPNGPKSPLVPAPATLSLTPSGIAALVNEATSTTDPGSAPAFRDAKSPGRQGARAKGRKGAAASPKAEAVEPVPTSSSRRGKRASQAEKASASPAVKGDAASSRAERTSAAPPEPGGTAAPARRAEQRAAAPAAAAPAPKAPRRAEPPRLSPTANADPAPKSPAAPRSPTARGDTPAPPPRAPQPVSDGEPSVAATRALGASGRPPAPTARAAPAEGGPPPRSGSGMDRLETQEPMDLGSAPVAETRLISWEAPPGRMQPVRRIVRARPEGTVSGGAPGKPAAVKPAAPEVPVRVGPGAVETRESPVVSEPSPDTDEPNAFKHLRERPLDAKPYRESAAYFDSRGDTGRAALMREIADALDGREPPAAPRVQRPPLTMEERAGLRHPGLRTPSGELLACAGLALCRLFPAQGRAAGTSEPLRATSGPGAPAVLDALHTAARVLDVHLPELFLAEDEGPPFTAVHAGQPRLLVGRLSIRQPLSVAELRFHAGRALLSLSPDLMALRALKGGQLLRALALLATILRDPRASSPEARVVRDSLSPRALERALALLDDGTRDFKASALADAARDSANRAGLVACGSVGTALAVLRARRNQDSELVELLRFAASERYLELRAPR